MCSFSIGQHYRLAKTTYVRFFQGTRRHAGEPVHPQESVVEQDVVFPDKHEDQKQPFVFVWKTCGTFDAYIHLLTLSICCRCIGGSDVDSGHLNLIENYLL